MIFILHDHLIVCLYVCVCVCEHREETENGNIVFKKNVYPGPLISYVYECISTYEQMKRWWKHKTESHHHLTLETISPPKTVIVMMIIIIIIIINSNINDYNNEKEHMYSQLGKRMKGYFLCFFGNNKKNTKKKTQQQQHIPHSHLSHFMLFC